MSGGGTTTVSDPRAAGRASLRLSARPWWPRVRRVATWLFLLVVAVLLVRQARTIDWPQVMSALAGLPPATLGVAALLAAASHLLYSSFDLVGRRLTRHSLPTGAVMRTTFVSYAFNLNFGSLIGGVAFRYRLYSRMGLSGHTITRVLGYSMLTNWLGYLALAGTLFLWMPPALPDGWEIGRAGLRVLGAALLVLALAYLALCAHGGGRRWHIRGGAVQLPPLSVASLQLAVSVLNWALMGAMVWTLLRGQAGYAAVLTVLLVAAVAGVITHVPAGLGVLEAVFVALLSPPVAQAPLLAALLAYRGLYYLAPLAIALAVYAVTEWRHRRAGRAQKR